MERKGHKVCLSTAKKINAFVSQLIDIYGRVPLSGNTRNTLREWARYDADLHRSKDPEFRIGGGPSVVREDRIVQTPRESIAPNSSANEG